MHPFFNVIPGRVGKYQVESNSFFHPRLRSETPMVIVAKPEMTLRLLFRGGAVGKAQNGEPRDIEHREKQGERQA